MKPILIEINKADWALLYTDRWIDMKHTGDFEKPFLLNTVKVANTGIDHEGSEENDCA